MRRGYSSPFFGVCGEALSVLPWHERMMCDEARGLKLAPLGCLMLLRRTRRREAVDTRESSRARHGKRVVSFHAHFASQRRTSDAAKVDAVAVSAAVRQVVAEVCSVERDRLAVRQHAHVVPYHLRQRASPISRVVIAAGTSNAPLRRGTTANRGSATQPQRLRRCARAAR